MHTFIVFCASYLIVLVCLGALLAFYWLKAPLRLRYALLVICSGAVAFVLSLLAAHLHYESRPFVVEHIQPLIKHGADNGFPSDHALLSMTLTAATYFYNRKVAAWMLAGCILIGWARVAAHLHSPQQIAAGWVLGIIGVLVAYVALRFFRTRDHENQKEA